MTADQPALPHHHPSGCVAACVARVQRKRDRHELYHYKLAPMPYCTWGPESGPPSASNPEWSGPRYRIVNSTSGAGGKYQFMPSTWRAIGGLGLPQFARPVLQERMARRLLRIQGLGAWSNC